MALRLSPGHIHPLFWVARHHLGLTYEYISSRVGISKPTLVKFEDGYSISDTHQVKLYDLITQERDYIAEQEAIIRDLKEPFKSYARAYWQVINSVLDIYSYARYGQLPRSTDLSKALTLLLSSTPILKSRVIQILSASYNPRAIAKCARRISVIETVSPSGKLLWALPLAYQQLNRPTPSHHPPKYTVRASTPHRERLHQRISVLLGRAPECKLPAKELQHALTSGKERWSMPTIRRAFREMQLIRERVGWGPGSVTYWALPHVKEPNE